MIASPGRPQSGKRCLPVPLGESADRFSRHAEESRSKHPRGHGPRGPRDIRFRSSNGPSAVVRPRPRSPRQSIRHSEGADSQSPHHPVLQSCVANSKYLLGDGSNATPGVIYEVIHIEGKKVVCLTYSWLLCSEHWVAPRLTKTALAYPKNSAAHPLFGCAFSAPEVKSAARR